MNPKPTIWTNVGLPRDEIERMRTVLAGQSAELIHEPGIVASRLGEADVAFGQPPVDAVLASKRLRWVQVSSAGITRYDTEDFRKAMTGRGTVFTNSSGVYNEPCAQHAAAMVLALARQLPMGLDDQRGKHGWLGTQMRERAHLLGGQTVLIFGFGAIGKKLAGYLTAFGMNVTGVRRKPRGDEGFPMVATEQAEAMLGKTDHMVDILPSSRSTDGFFDARRIGLMSPETYFYNIGRGATVDQPALIEALKSNRIRGAYLDVMTPEPLPPDHVLWTLPNCWITPHSAGGHADEPRRLCRHFIDNFERFAAGKLLVDQVM
jgi:phosphoglycerate dehydrogenase-like enzyme